MSKKLIEKLYGLKEQGVEHLKVGRYNNSSVYFRDILLKFQEAIQQIQTEQEMERAIRELKLSAHKNLSLCYLKVEKYALCVKECEIVLDIEPHNIKMLYRIGEAWIGLKNYDKAEIYLKKGFLLDPQQKQIMKGLEQIQTQRNLLKDANKPKQSMLMRLILLILQVIFWFPLLLYRKGRIWCSFSEQRKLK